ncbi:hypothetical protein P3T76_001089 [Phytophthora citrophthora]|uniref:Tf2-1-like SH3-like domain-containing protein n=1 Tax=Phytophthora citrophthora TaxID=4793 RepID=A0AAD9LUE5_9STRA|nr:hypothetical protein P3T76_001089 [Phytophthora citrophthora]
MSSDPVGWKPSLKLVIRCGCTSTSEPRRGERTTKKLAFSWHGPYRIVSAVGENTYRVAIPSHPNRVVSINVNRLKRFQGR